MTDTQKARQIEAKLITDKTLAALQATTDPVERQKILDADIAAIREINDRDRLERGLRFLEHCLQDPEIARVFAKIGVRSA